ncbi:MAG: hypothetical protein AB7P03_18130 [Kofleriaceae bacterium]
MAVAPLGLLSVRWVLIGAVAGVGAWWFFVALMLSCGVQTEALPYIAHAGAAATVGNLMMRFRPFRPSREPVAAAVLAIGLMVVVFILLPHWFMWVAARSSRPWLVAPAIALGAAASAFLGAFPSRRTLGTVPRLVSILMLSAFLTLGVTPLLGNVLFAVLGPGDLVLFGFVVTPIAVFAAGFLTQLVTPTYRPWACGAGWFFALGLVVKERWSAAPGVPLIDGETLIISIGVLLLGAFGAQLAGRFAPAPEAESGVPRAHLE